MVDHIKRRSFLAGLAALGVVPEFGGSAQAGAVGSGGRTKRFDLRITKVEILQLTGKNKRRALYLKLHTNADAVGLYQQQAVDTVDRGDSLERGVDVVGGSDEVGGVCCGGVGQGGVAGDNGGQVAAPEAEGVAHCPR